jgi:hypothetical protein
MDIQVNIRNQTNPARELKRLEQMQANLFLNVNLALRKSIEEYLNKQENTLDENGEIKKEITQKIIEMFMEFAKDTILHQERAEKLKNKEYITAKDIDDQITQVRLFNW